MQPEPNRTGFVLGADSMPRQRLIDLARHVEALGYEALWVGETWGRDAFGVLAQLAIHTTHVTLGTAVVSAFSRGPGLLAQSIATLDEISDGRAILGLGPSSRTLVEDWHGLHFERPIARIRELVPLLRRILAGERIDFEGEFFRMHGLRLPFEPLRREIPIYLAALSPRHLELAGEIANGWVPTYLSTRHLDWFREHLATGAARSGRSLDAIVQAPWLLTCAAEDPEHARSLARNHLAFYTTAYGDAYQKQARRYGFVEEADRLGELWRDDRENLASGVSDEMLDALSITGTPAECRDAFAALREKGVDLPAILVPTRAPFEIVRGTLEALAPSL